MLVPVVHVEVRSPKVPSARVIWGITLVLLVLIGASAVATFRHFAHAIQRTTLNDLQAVAAAKKGEIELYLHERRGDAETIASFAPIWQSVEVGDPLPAALLESRGRVLDQFRSSYGYDRIRVTDLNLRVIGPDKGDPLQPPERQAMSAAIATRSPSFVDAHGDRDGKARFGIADAVFAQGDRNGAVIGAIYLELNVKDDLYPVVAHWPVESRTAESIIIHQRGNEVEYLSPLRNPPSNNSTVLRRAIDDQALVCAQALRASQPVSLMGHDYRGVPVFAAAAPIEGSDWFLVVKMDQEEVESPIRLLALAVTTVALGAVFLLLVAGMLLWRKQQAEYLADSMLLAARSRAASQGSIDGYLVADPKDQVIDVNPAMERMSGYTREELLRMKVSELDATMTPEQFAVMKRQVIEAGSLRAQVQMRTKQGGLVDADLSLTYVGDSSGGTIHAYLHDIGPRLAHERQIRRLNKFYAFLSRSNAALFNLSTPEEILREVCEGSVEDGGMRLTWAAMLDESGQRVHPVAGVGVGWEYVRDHADIRMDLKPGMPPGPVLAAMRERSVVTSTDLPTDPLLAPWREACIKFGWRSGAVVPVVVEDKAVAVLVFCSSEKTHFDQQLLALLEEVARNVSLAWQTALARHREALAEAAREESEQRFTRMFEHSPLPLLTASLKTNEVLVANQAFRRVFGYPLEEIRDAGKFAERVFPNPEERALHAKSWNEALEQARVSQPGTVFISGEMPFRCASGDTRLMRAFLTVVSESLLLQFEDLTDIRLAEAARAESEERFTRIFDHAPIPILALSLSTGKVLSFNQSFSKLFGYTLEECPDEESLFRAAYPDGEYREKIRKLFAEHVQMVAAAGRSALEEAAETQVLCKDGRVRTMRGFLDVVGDEAIVQWVDLTEMREAEAARAESQQRFARIFHDSPRPMQIISLSTRKNREVNASFVRAFGYTLLDAPADLTLIAKAFPDPAYHAEMVQFWENRLVEATSAPAGTLFDSPDVTVTCKDGSTKIVRGFMTISGDDAILQWDDITEIRRAEAKLLEGERRFRTMVEQGIAGVFVMQDQKMVYANPRFFEISGWEPADLRKDPAVLIPDPEMRQAIAKGRQALAEGAKTVHFVAPFTRRTGEKLEVELYGSWCMWEGRDAVLLFGHDVTEIRRAQETLRQSEDRFRTMVELSIAGVCVMQDGKVVYTNPRLREIAGWSEADLGRDSLDMVEDAQLRDLIAQGRKQMQEGARTSKCSGTFTNRLGERRSVEMFATKGLWGGREAVLTFVHDLTDIRRVEQALRENEQRFRGMIEQNVIGVHVTVGGKLVYANPKVREASGWTDEEIGKDCAGRYADPAMLEAVRAAERRLVEGEPSVSFVMAFTSQRGKKVEWQVHAARGVWDGQEATIVFSQDLTDLRRAEAAIVENERRFRSLIEQTVVGVHVVQDNKIVYANPRMCEITGWSADELVGSDPMDLFRDPEVQQNIEAVRANLMQGFRSDTRSTPFVTKKGERLELMVHTSVFTWDGRDALVVISQDMTERRRSEQMIADYAKQLEGAVQGTLLAVSNMLDLRDPYTSGHERRVGIIAADIARQMGWKESQCEALRWAALVHDIGKIALPAEVLSKPTKLTKLEFEMIKEHPEKGYEILRDVRFPAPIAEIIRQHHEHLDGTGYPRQLKGEEICIEARILMVADVIEAMSTHRPYRPALRLEEVLREIEIHRETWYDPTVVDTLMHMIREQNYQLPV